MKKKKRKEERLSGRCTYTQEVSYTYTTSENLCGEEEEEEEATAADDVVTFACCPPFPYIKTEDVFSNRAHNSKHIPRVDTFTISSFNP